MKTVSFPLLWGRGTVLVWLFCSGCVATPVSTDWNVELRAEALVDQGIQLLRAGEGDAADASFETAYEVAPLAAALDGRGCVAYLRGDYLSAAQWFEKALTEDPEYHHAMGNLAMVYEVLGREREAEQLYRGAISANPENFRARNNLAALLVKGHAPQATRRELTKAAAIAPHPVIMSNLRKVSEP